MANYKEVYESCWKQIIEDETGNINKDQLMKELCDYKYLLDSNPIDTYNHTALSLVDLC